MGRFNELLNTGALFGRGFGIGLGLQEQEGVTTSAPELMPTYSLDDQLDRYALTAGILQMGLQQGLAAGGVGFRSQIAMDNPAGSGWVVTLERIIIFSTAQEDLLLGWSATQLTGSTGNLVARDSRQISTPGFGAPSPARIRTQNNAAQTGLASNIAQLRMPANTPQDYHLDLVIAPGHSVRLFPGADNTAIASAITFFTRSRPINLRELTL